MIQSITSLLIVLLLDVVLVGLIVLALVPLAIFRKAAFAVLKRNFVSYFTTPTGYVFLCLFVWLSSSAAFFPHDFFASNMATLDQLNFWMPMILLLFIPAITMSIWADERRQGTDELLLTIPADDFDIVLGKYLAAAAIFTASLLFSQLANFSVLNYVALGEVDLGLYFTTYVGYWFMGMAMLSIGMVASFLTKNLTVGFILGALFNAPLVIAGYADVIVSNVDVSQAIAAWSMSAQFENFGRGVISIASVAYFSMLIALGIYVSMLLIGRRHWLGGKDGHSMIGHYIVRVVALAVAAFAATVFFTSHDFIRKDATSERISELSPDTYRLIRNLDLSRPVRVEAYVSKTLPDAFVRTKYDLVNLLKELQAIGGRNIQVAINDRMEPFSEQAKQAEDRYGIRPVTVTHEAHGAFKQEEVFLAAAFSSGAERVVVPFFGPGTPVEYELVRSITTVADEEEPEDENEDENEDEKRRGRQKIGIMRTDAQLTGGFNFQTFAQFDAQLIVDELRKQYEVEDVDPNSEVDKDEFDVLVVVQPSSLTPAQLPNLLNAIRDGIPTAIFEDPAPVRFQGGANPYVPGTDDPKRSPGGMMGMRRGPQPKCEIKELWDLLGVYMVNAKQGRRASGQDAIRRDREKGTIEVKVNWEPFTPVVWQHYNPYPKDPNIPDAAVFANPNAEGAEEVFNANEPAVAGLREVLFMAPGAFEEAQSKPPEAKGLTFTPLVTTGTDSGLQSLRQVQPPGLKQIKNQRDVEATEQWVDIVRVTRQEADPRLRTQQPYVLAARITGELNTGSQSDEQESADESDGDGEADADSDEDNAQSDDGNGSEEDDGGDEDGAGKNEDAADEESDNSEVDVILVADVDLLESLFVRLRDQPPMGGIEYQFQNVTFALNLIDVLADDHRFINIRKRKRHHASLKLIEQQIRAAEEKSLDKIKEFEQELKDTLEDSDQKRREIVQSLTEELMRAQQEGKLDSRKLRELEQKRDWQEEQNKQRREKEAQRHARQLQAELRQIQRDLDLERRRIQNTYKRYAILLPTIPPLMIGFAVLIFRWVRERETVSQARRR